MFGHDSEPDRSEMGLSCGVSLTRLREAPLFEPLTALPFLSHIPSDYSQYSSSLRNL